MLQNMRTPFSLSACPTALGRVVQGVHWTLGLAIGALLLAAWATGELPTRRRQRKWTGLESSQSRPSTRASSRYTPGWSTGNSSRPERSSPRAAPSQITLTSATRGSSARRTAGPARRQPGARAGRPRRALAAHGDRRLAAALGPEARACGRRDERAMEPGSAGSECGDQSRPVCAGVATQWLPADQVGPQEPER